MPDLLLIPIHSFFGESIFYWRKNPFASSTKSSNCRFRFLSSAHLEFGYPARNPQSQFGGIVRFMRFHRVGKRFDYFCLAFFDHFDFYTFIHKFIFIFDIGIVICGIMRETKITVMHSTLSVLSSSRPSWGYLFIDRQLYYQHPIIPRERTFAPRFRKKALLHVLFEKSGNRKRYSDSF